MSAPSRHSGIQRELQAQTPVRTKFLLGIAVDPGDWIRERAEKIGEEKDLTPAELTPGSSGLVQGGCRTRR
jgi:hypothetical protein